ncbi:MAG: tRNA (adenosine(37)-N6)-dimethylallyltransferase MiaA [Planctomycetota bacterium]
MENRSAAENRATPERRAENRVITVVGVTAAGKGALARGLARRLGAEILSIDSMKVYRGMDIGTAKPPAEVRAAIPHHLIDVADPWESFSVARFVELADRAVETIHARGRPVVAVGGTVLYLKCWYEGIFTGPSTDPVIRAALRRRAASEGAAALHAELARIDPAAAERIHRNDVRRIERALEVYQLTGQPITALQQQWAAGRPRRADWRWLPLGIERPRAEANQRINLRVKRMLAAGLVAEARRLWSDPRGLGPQARQAVGYAELCDHFEGRLTLDEAIERIKINTRRLAKHQRTWLKRMRHVHWLNAAADEAGRDHVSRAGGAGAAREDDAGAVLSRALDLLSAAGM